MSCPLHSVSPALDCTVSVCCISQRRCSAVDPHILRLCDIWALDHHPASLHWPRSTKAAHDRTISNRTTRSMCTACHLNEILLVHSTELYAAELHANILHVAKLPATELHIIARSAVCMPLQAPYAPTGWHCSTRSGCLVRLVKLVSWLRMTASKQPWDIKLDRKCSPAAATSLLHCTFQISTQIHTQPSSINLHSTAGFDFCSMWFMNLKLRMLAQMLIRIYFNTQPHLKCNKLSVALHVSVGI